MLAVSSDEPDDGDVVVDGVTTLATGFVDDDVTVLIKKILIKLKSNSQIK